MVTMTVGAKVKPKKQEEFIQTITSLNGEQEKQKSSRNLVLYKEIGDKNRFSVTYEWETQEDWERYLGSEKFRVLLGALTVLCEESEIRCSQPFWDRRSIPLVKE